MGEAIKYKARKRGDGDFELETHRQQKSTATGKMVFVLYRTRHMSMTEAENDVSDAQAKLEKRKQILEALKKAEK
jgi:hypothetical protein